MAFAKRAGGAYREPPMIGRLPPRRARLLTAVLLVLALSGLAMAPAARGQGLWTAASDGVLWLVRSQQSGGTIHIYCRFASDPPGQLRSLTTLSGRLTGIAASSHRLWLVFSNGSVAALDVPAVSDGRTLPVVPYIATPLSADVQVAALAATESGLWALARHSDDTLLPMQQVSEAESAVESGGAAPAERSGNRRAGEQAVPSAPAPPTQPETDQLLHLQAARWQTVGLPSPWPHGAPAMLVANGDTNDWPTLITDDPKTGVCLYSPQGGPVEQWVTMALGHSSSGPWRAVSVRQQVILIERRAESTHLAVRLWLARPSGLSILGELALPQIPAGALWSMSGPGDKIALGAFHQGELRWTACDLTGRQLISPQPLIPQRAPSLLDQPDVVLLSAGLAVAGLLLVYVLARRAGGYGQQPREVPLASLAARAVAAVIDLVPCFAAVIVLFPAVVSKVGFDYWPGRSGSWSAMLPGTLVIVLFVGHTVVAEAIWGQSLGKRLVGVRVVDMAGQRPRLWQVLGRNVLKALDLIVPPLLVMLVISPLRQRLGDLVTETLVAVDHPPAGHGEQGEPPQGAGSDAQADRSTGGDKSRR